MPIFINNPHTFYEIVSSLLKNSPDFFLSKSLRELWLYKQTPDPVSLRGPRDHAYVQEHHGVRPGSRGHGGPLAGVPLAQGYISAVVFATKSLISSDQSRHRLWCQSASFRFW